MNQNNLATNQSYIQALNCICAGLTATSFWVTLYLLSLKICKSVSLHATNFIWCSNSRWQYLSVVIIFINTHSIKCYDVSNQKNRISLAVYVEISLRRHHWNLVRPVHRSYKNSCYHIISGVDLFKSLTFRLTPNNQIMITLLLSVCFAIIQITSARKFNELSQIKSHLFCVKINRQEN